MFALEPDVFSEVDSKCELGFDVRIRVSNFGPESKMAELNKSSVRLGDITSLQNPYSHFRLTTPSPTEQFDSILPAVAAMHYNLSTLLLGSLIDRSFFDVEESIQFLKSVGIIGVSREESAQAKFSRLANEWRRDTGMISLLHKKVMHPAYQQIIGMGKEALPFIFQELKERKGHWMWALCSITGQDAARSCRKVGEAIEAWLRWGAQHGYI